MKNGTQQKRMVGVSNKKKYANRLLIIDEKYAISSDANCWQLCEKRMIKGEATYKPIKYGTFSNMCHAYLDLKVQTSDYNSIEDIKQNIAEAKGTILSVLRGEGLLGDLIE